MMDEFSLVLEEHFSPGGQNKIKVILILMQKQVSGAKAPKAKRVNLLFIKTERVCSHLDARFLSNI